MACVDTTTVLYEGDGDPALLTAAIVERLVRIEPLLTNDERATLDSNNSSTRREFWPATWLSRSRKRRCSAVPIRWLLRLVTAVLHCSQQCSCYARVWISPWSHGVGLELLRHSLVITVSTDEEQLIDDLITESAISKVYSGHYSTCYAVSAIRNARFMADTLYV